MYRMVGDGVGVDGVGRKKEYIPLCVHILSFALPSIARLKLRF